MRIARIARHGITLLPKHFYLECLLVLLGHFFYGAYIKNTDIVIRSDGKGYYDYLPAAAIYHDFSFSFRSGEIEYAEKNTAHNIPYNGKIVNKYPCGLALLWAPFFGLTHEWLKNSPEIAHNGYSLPYHFAVYVAALFYLLAGLVFLRKLLYLYDAKGIQVIIIQCVFLFGTNLFAYAYYDSSFGHVYSFSLIIMFLYAYVKWFRSEKVKYLYFFSAVLALIILVRPFNILVLLFIPYFSGGFGNIRKIGGHIAKRPVHTVMAFLLFLSIVFIQPLIWYWQAGSFFPWTYTEEKFVFTDPALWQTLLGFRKGLLIYTPVLLVALTAFIVLFRKKNRALGWSLLAALFVLHYFISAWQTWWYGASFGLRPYIDFYAVFACMMLVSLQQINRWLKIPVALFMLFSILVNLVQTYQYSRYILLWDDMNAQRYADIFLKTDEKYNGILFYEKFSDIRGVLQVRESVPIMQRDTLMTKGGWRSFPLAKMETDTSAIHRFVFSVQLDISTDSSDRSSFYISLDTGGKEIFYEQKGLFQLTWGKKGPQEIRYYIDVPFTGGKTVGIKSGFVNLEEAVRVRHVEMQTLK